MARIYGKDFAAVYNDYWAFFGVRMWPFLLSAVVRRTPHARSWLDLCCGAGSLLKFVCQSGYEAVGLDRSAHQLKHARLNAPAARLVRADVRRFSLARRFDAVTCIFDSLNYLTRRRDLGQAFRCARRHLADSGCFIFDVNTFEGLQDTWRRTTTIRDRRRLIIIESSFEPKTALGLCRITGFLKQGPLYRRFEEDHIQRGYRAAEIDELLTRAGFAFRKYDGRFSRPKKRSGRLIYVCQRAR